MSREEKSIGDLLGGKLPTEDQERENAYSRLRMAAIEAKAKNPSLSNRAAVAKAVRQNPKLADVARGAAPTQSEKLEQRRRERALEKLREKASRIRKDASEPLSDAQAFKRAVEEHPGLVKRVRGRD